MQDKKFAGLAKIVKNEGNLVEQKINNIVVRENA